MNLRIEIDPSAEEEIILRGPAFTPDMEKLQQLLKRVLYQKEEIALVLNDEEHFIRAGDILFFETANGRVTAHTAERMYSSQSTLTRLEETLPYYFTRASKSCLINVRRIASISRSLTGASETRFRGSDKIVYISRMYYKPVHDLLEKIRL